MTAAYRIRLVAARAAGCVLVACSLLACGNDAAPLGRDCIADTDCASGLCVVLDGQPVCSEPCTAGASCPSAPDDPLLTCREGDVCGPRCTFAGVQADFQCDSDGTVRSCAAGNDVADCSVCGCSYFGGGRCVVGMGCIDPLPAGATCTVDDVCESFLCRPDTGVCTAPIPDGGACPADEYCVSRICGAGGSCLSPGNLGAACREDRECASAHCSTDGNTSMVGTCEIGVGRACGTLISMNDPDCSLCRGAGFGNLCFRENCNDTNARCPSDWACRDTADGGTACFERCDPDRPFSGCAVSTAQCSSNGICSRTF